MTHLFFTGIPPHYLIYLYVIRISKEIFREGIP